MSKSQLVIQLPCQIELTGRSLAKPSDSPTSFSIAALSLSFCPAREGSALTAAEMNCWTCEDIFRMVEMALVVRVWIYALFARVVSIYRTGLWKERFAEI